MTVYCLYVILGNNFRWKKRQHKINHTMSMALVAVNLMNFTTNLVMRIGKGCFDIKFSKQNFPFSLHRRRRFLFASFFPVANNFSIDFFLLFMLYVVPLCCAFLKTILLHRIKPANKHTQNVKLIKVFSQLFEYKFKRASLFS